MLLYVFSLNNITLKSECPSNIDGSLEIDGRTLSLKIPYTWGTEHKETKLVLVQKFHLYWLDFIGFLHTSERESHHQPHPALQTLQGAMTDLKRYAVIVEKSWSKQQLTDYL